VGGGEAALTSQPTALWLPQNTPPPHHNHKLSLPLTHLGCADVTGLILLCILLLALVGGGRLTRLALATLTLLALALAGWLLLLLLLNRLLLPRRGRTGLLGDLCQLLREELRVEARAVQQLIQLLEALL